MNQDSKEAFERIVSAVQSTVNGISKLFEVLGAKGMKELIDPSITDLITVINGMKQRAESYGKDLQESNTPDACHALILLQNIKQGLFYAESLLDGVERQDIKTCDEAHRDMQRNSIIVPEWSEDETDKEDKEDL